MDQWSSNLPRNREMMTDAYVVTYHSDNAITLMTSIKRGSKQLPATVYAYVNNIEGVGNHWTNVRHIVSP